MSASLKVTGIKELDNLLIGLPSEVTYPILTATSRTAAKPLVDLEKALAPIGATHNLVNSIGIIKASDDVGGVVVGPRRRGGYKGFAAHLIEFGTAVRELLGKGLYRKGTKRGKLKPEPFIEPAFLQTNGKIIDSMVLILSKKIVARMKRELKGSFVK
jgi:hypothetical protein